MARAVSMSFEGNGVKVVEATVRGKTTIVREAYAFPVGELESYLDSSRARDFVVSADFKSSWQEMVFLPPVKKGLVKKLLAAEVRKRNPSILGELALISFKTGEKLVEGKKLIEHFVFAVAGVEIDELVEKFLSRGKRISALYPNMLAVLKILPVKEKPYICHYETGNKKNLFLIKGGKVLFSRSAPSIGHGLVDYDIQNINMTVNYCRQSIRIEPEEVLCIGLSGSANATKAQVPMSFLTKPENVVVEDDVAGNFLIPISALGKGDTESIFTDSYRRFHMLSKVVVEGTVLFALAALLLAAVTGFNLSRNSDLSSRLASIIQKNAGLQSAIEENQRVRDEILAYKPYMDFIERLRERPSLVPLLYALRQLDVEGVEVRSFEASPSGNELVVRMSGSIAGDSLSGTQRRFDLLLADLNRTPGFVAADGRLALKEATFHVDGRYRPGGG